MRRGPVKQAVAELYSLLLLGPNWDGEGADPVDKVCVERAETLLCKVYQTVRGLEIEWSGPSIAPTPEGGVCVAFEDDEADPDDGKYVLIFASPGQAKFEVIVARPGDDPERHYEFLREAAQWAVWSME